MTKNKLEPVPVYITKDLTSHFIVCSISLFCPLLLSELSTVLSTGCSYSTGISDWFVVVVKGPGTYFVATQPRYYAEFFARKFYFRFCVLFFPGSEVFRLMLIFKVFFKLFRLVSRNFVSVLVLCIS